MIRQKLYIILLVILCIITSGTQVVLANISSKENTDDTIIKNSQQSEENINNTEDDSLPATEETPSNEDLSTDENPPTEPEDSEDFDAPLDPTDSGDSKDSNSSDDLTDLIEDSDSQPNETTEDSDSSGNNDSNNDDSDIDDSDNDALKKLIGDTFFILTEEDLARLKNLYAEILILESTGNNDSSEKWDEFNSIILKYSTPSLKEFLGDTYDTLSPDTLSKLSVIYDEIIQLERQGNMEAANLKRAEFNEVLQFENRTAKKSLPPFTEFIKYFEKDIPKSVKSNLESIYNNILLYEQKIELTEVDQNNLSNQWSKFYSLIDKYTAPEINNTSEYVLDFESFIGSYISKISESDLNAMRVLYNDAISLESTGNTSQSQIKWNEFYDIYDKYISSNPDFVIMVRNIRSKMTKYDLYRSSMIYNKIIELEKNHLFEESKYQWDLLSKILSKYEPKSD